jgi:hypothetical protein
MLSVLCQSTSYNRHIPFLLDWAEKHVFSARRRVHRPKEDVTAKMISVYPATQGETASAVAQRKR